MKIEQLLVQHFYSHREITLQGMGTFTLSPDFNLPSDNDKEISMPENTITFHFNPKATEDEELISFIVQQTRKIRPLASADLDSYLVLGKQFLNIGKPFIIEGLGILEKSQQGDYEFKQGPYLNSKVEAAPGLLKEKADDDISFAAIKQKSSGKRKNWLIAVLILFIGLIASATWYYLHNKKEQDVTLNTDTEIEAPSIQNVTDTNKVLPALQNADSLKATVLPANEYTFKLVFKETINKEAAIAKMNDLIKRKHFVIMYTKDSVYYKLAEPFKLPLSDTTRIKDSLNKYYYKEKGYIELN